MSPRFLRLQDPHRFLRSYILQHSWTIIVYNVVFPSIPYILKGFQSLHPKSLPSPSYPNLTATPHPSVLTKSPTHQSTPSHTFHCALDPYIPIYISRPSPTSH